jgi:undecaprenyl pyrophosphate phosphatase UppP
MNDFIEKDPLLQKLLNKSTLEEPSADFTLNIMAKINAASHLQTYTVKESFFSKNYLSLSLITLVISFVILYIVFPQLFSFINQQSVLNLIKPYLELISSVSFYLKSNLIVGIIAVSVVGLLFFDKILSSLFHSKIQHNQHVW